MFIHESRSEGPFQVAIDLNSAGTQRLRGYVIGDDAVAERLRFPRGRLKIVSADNDVENIVIEGVHIGTFYPAGGANRADREFSRMVARFSANNATVRSEGLTETAGIEVVFHLNGPHRLWPVWKDKDGYKDNEFALAGFSFAVVPIRVAERGADDSPERYTDVLQVRARPLPDAANQTPEQAIMQSTAAIEDVLTLMSLLHRGHIHWHERHLYTPNTSVRTNRSYVVSRKESPRWEHAIVDHRSIYEFIGTGVQSLRRWRENKYPIELSIAYRINGARGRLTITQQFTTLFLSLESLTTTYAKSRDLGQIVSDKRFRAKVKPAIENAIRTCAVLDDEQQQLMIDKALELNRPNFRDVLAKLTAEYRVSGRTCILTENLQTDSRTSLPCDIGSFTEHQLYPNIASR